MTAPLPLTPQITCRFWQAPYSLRPQVGSIGVLKHPIHNRHPRAAPQYDTDVEDDLQYGLRNKYAWVWRPLEETSGGGVVTPDDLHIQHLDPSDPILDFLGDHDLSDSDGADDSLETKEFPG